MPQTSPSSLKLSINASSVEVSGGDSIKSNEKVTEEITISTATPEGPAVSDCVLSQEAFAENDVNTSTQLSTKDDTHHNNSTVMTGKDVFDLSSPSSGKCLPCVTQISSRVDNDFSKVSLTFDYSHKKQQHDYYSVLREDAGVACRLCYSMLIMFLSCSGAR